MHGAANPASLAITISVGTSLLGGFIGMWIAIRSRRDASENRDTAVSVLFAIACLLLLLYVAAAALVANSGVAYVGLAKSALLLTAAFALLGTAFGLMRGLRSGRATRPHGT